MRVVRLLRGAALVLGAAASMATVAYASETQRYDNGGDYDGGRSPVYEGRSEAAADAIRQTDLRRDPIFGWERSEGGGGGSGSGGGH